LRFAATHGVRAEEVIAAERGPDILRPSGGGAGETAINGNVAGSDAAITAEANVLGSGFGRSSASRGAVSAETARTDHGVETRSDGTVSAVSGRDHAYPTSKAQSAKSAVGRSHPEGGTRPRGGAENPQSSSS
jgi:hypothetical protein